MEITEKWPVLGRHERAAEWLRVWADLGHAPRTIDALGLTEYLQMCEREGIDPITAHRAHIAVYVRELTERPRPQGRERRVDGLWGRAGQRDHPAVIGAGAAVLRLLDGGGAAGGQPGGPGRYTLGRRSGGHERGLVPRLTTLPWIPSKREWAELLAVASKEPVRNRVMLALAYDEALRREKLCWLRTDDLDPAHRTLRVRAETTKNRLERVVPYSVSTGVLLMDYLAHRARISRARGPLFLSESRRNHAQPLSLWTWSKVVRRVAVEAKVPPVFHAHHTAFVLDGPGADGLGAARHRDFRRSSLDRRDPGLHPSIRWGVG